MVKALSDDLAGARNKAILLIGFAGALRRSEIANLRVEAITFDVRGMILALGKTKTDQSGEHEEIAIPLLAHVREEIPSMVTIVACCRVAVEGGLTVGGAEACGLLLVLALDIEDSVAVGPVEEIRDTTPPALFGTCRCNH